MRFVGHRGASAIAPENTLQAVNLALAVGAGFEVDLQVLSDGTVVLLHDDTLWRTVTPLSWLALLSGAGSSRRALLRRPVGELSSNDVSTVTVGDHAEPLPTFASALKLLREPPRCETVAHGSACDSGPKGGTARFVHCFAEIKADGHTSSATFDPRLTAASAAAVVQAAIAPSQLTWISFSLSALLDIKRRLPEHAALLVAYVGTSAQAWALARLAVSSELDGVDLNADPAVVTTELVEWLHARGKRVAVWVWKAPASNDVEPVWEHMERCGVDYFTSNMPAALTEWRAKI